MPAGSTRRRPNRVRVSRESQERWGLTREEALAMVEEALAKASAQPQVRVRPQELAVMRFIVQLIGIGVVCAGFSILFAVFSGYKRPLRALGIATNVETGILVMVVGGSLAWMSSRPSYLGTRRQEPPAPAPQRAAKQCSICAEELLVDAVMCANCDESQWLN